MYRSRLLFNKSACSECTKLWSRSVYGFTNAENGNYSNLLNQYAEDRKQHLVSRPAVYPSSSQQSLLSRIIALLTNRDKSQAVPSGAQITQIVNTYRRDGHKFAKVDPLQNDHKFRSYCFKHQNATDISALLPISAAEETIDVTCNPDLHNLFGGPTSSISYSELKNRLNDVYCGHVTAEFEHIDDEFERAWFAREFEKMHNDVVEDCDLKALAEVMLKCQAFDNYLATKFSQVKRYGGEGAEAMMGFFWELFRTCPNDGISDIFIGMPHRGRLNLLVNLLDYPAVHMFQKMKGKPEFLPDVDALGDVLSHLSTSVDITIGEKPVHVNLLPNPSHLEAVDPVVVGKCRAREQCYGIGDYNGVNGEQSLPGDRALPLLIHGDASVAGQGVVAETLNFSQTPHFRTGGSIHLVVNNQVGFTTTPDKGRSSRYCTDIAKLVSCPVIHVNGDRADLLLKATRLAFRYRQLFRKDVFIDLVCFRMWGHNELDDPTFTQPHMYAKIKPRQQDTVPMKFSQHLATKGLMSEDDAKKILADYKQTLQDEFNRIDNYAPEKTHLGQHWSDLVMPPNAVEVWNTGVDVEKLKEITTNSVTVPEEATVHDHLNKIHIEARRKKAEDGTGFDFGSAEALAFGSLLSEDVSVRISGQDVGRGTFSQRHVVLHDQAVEDQQYIPLNHMSDSQSAFIEVANSILSEEATLGFEYGMSIESPKRLVVWEAQFGDFFNGAQIIIDTFVTSAETKWLLQSGLVVLLPHGLDGAGPEHSSCRMERFLQLTDSKEAGIDGANVNFEFAQPTTAAQYFHLLRRQIVRNYRKPLFVASPKLILRLPAACSSLLEMAPGTHFQPVLPDSNAPIAANVKKVIFCSGKHYYALDKERASRKLQDTAIIRLEMLELGNYYVQWVHHWALCPFPFGELQELSTTFTNCTDFVWSQEEARNSGAWSFVAPRFSNLLGINLRYCGRPEMAIPAVAIGQYHAQQIKDLMSDTFA